jgi:hypothetical protein
MQYFLNIVIYIIKKVILLIDEREMGRERLAAVIKSFGEAHKKK